MVAASGKKGFTWIELLVVILIIGIAIAVLLPAIQDNRGDHRRAHCINKMKQLGVALHNHENAARTFPASSTVPGGVGSSAVNGWSWLTFLLPFCEQQVLYDDLQVKKHPEGPSPQGTPLAYVTEVSAFVCPSYTGPKFRNADAKTGPLTQYKAMGATHIGSLEAAVPGGGNPGYPGSHPDGALYPGVQPKIASLVDGLSNTVMACETIEQKEAIWCLGSTATLVGLPPTVSYDNRHGQGTYYAPLGYNGRYDEEGATSHLLTYLRWDYDEHGPYISKEYRKGPGSEHPGVVNHLFGDGAVHSVNNDVDAALYFFIITRAGGDPPSVYSQPIE